MLRLHLGDREKEVRIQVHALRDLIIDPVSGIEDDSIVESRTTNTPEELRVPLLRGLHDGGIWKHYPHREQRIQCQAMEA